MKKIIKKVRKKIKKFLIQTLDIKNPLELNLNQKRDLIDFLSYEKLIDYDRAQLIKDNFAYCDLPVNYREFKQEDLEEDFTKAIDIAEFYYSKIKKFSIENLNKKILEIGPGTSLGSCAILKNYGFEVEVVDKYPSKWQDKYHNKYYEKLIKKYNDSEIIKNIKENKFNSFKIYTDLSNVGDETQDIVLSNAVLEHIEDFDEFAKQLYRITRKGGIHIHQIDFRDHRNFNAPLEYLLYSEVEFKKIFNSRFGECGHQRRFIDVKNYFLKSGFEMLISDEESSNMKADEDYLSYTVGRLRASDSLYKNYSKKDLESISNLIIITKK